jgi:hypothetical protein
MKTVVDNPAEALMIEVDAEWAIVTTPVAEALQQAICDAVGAYYEYLDRHGLFYDADRYLVKASGLHVICDMTGDIGIILKDGPADRRYGQGEDPDPLGPGRNPTWKDK